MSELSKLQPELYKTIRAEILEGPEVKALIQTLNNSLIIYRASQNQQELWEGWVDKFREKVREEFEI